MGSIGFDFGTTNSSAAGSKKGKTTMLGIDPTNDSSTIMKSVLFFSEESKIVYAGEDAIQQYIQDYTDGRFLRSIKRLLSSTTFTSTRLLGRSKNCVDIISVFLKIARERCESDLQRTVDNVILGRPVFFSDKPEIDKLAEKRLLDAAYQAGFKEVEFQLEPIAAALSFEQSLPDNHEKVVLMGDFGGGTSDFALVKLQKDNPHSKNRKDDVLGVGGIYIAGDEFDSLIMWEKLAKWFGKGTTYKSFEGRDHEFPIWILHKLRYWHLLPLLRERKTQQIIREIQQHSNNRSVINNLMTLIQDNLSILLFREIEAAKCDLSSRDKVSILFDHLGEAIEETLTTEEFEDFIHAEVKKISKAVDEVLIQAGVDLRDVDHVFLTGGSSRIPLIQEIFMKRFGIDKVKVGDAFSSIAYGLGLMASRTF